MKKKLMSGEAIVLNLVDKRKSPLTKDVYVTANVDGVIGYDICQGQSMMRFGGYREGNAQTKEVKKGW